MVAVTLGRGIEKGTTTATCYLVSREGEHMIEAQETAKETRGDTIGAGDAFAAGFLYGFLSGKDIGECGYLGDLVANFSVTRTGARAGLPSIQQLRQSYKWPR
jgi:ribokinase